MFVIANRRTAQRSLGGFVWPTSTAARIEGIYVRFDESDGPQGVGPRTWDIGGTEMWIGL